MNANSKEIRSTIVSISGAINKVLEVGAIHSVPVPFCMVSEEIASVSFGRQTEKRRRK